MGHVRAALAREGRGRGRVILVPRLGAAEEVEVALPGAFNVTPLLSQAMRVLPGVVEVHVGVSVNPGVRGTPHTAANAPPLLSPTTKAFPNMAYTPLLPSWAAATPVRRGTRVPYGKERNAASFITQKARSEKTVLAPRAGKGGRRAPPGGALGGRVAVEVAVGVAVEVGLPGALPLALPCVDLGEGVPVGLVPPTLGGEGEVVPVVVSEGMVVEEGQRVEVRVPSGALPLGVGEWVGVGGWESVTSGVVLGDKVSATNSVGVGVAKEVGVKVPLAPAPAPAAAPDEGEVEGVGAGRVGEGRLDAEAAFAGLPVGAPVDVEERDSVRVPLGVLELEELPLPLLPPLPVAVVVEEVEGEEVMEGEAWVGMWEARGEGLRVGSSGEAEAEWVGEDVPDRVGVMLCVAEVTR